MMLREGERVEGGGSGLNVVKRTKFSLVMPPQSLS